MPIQPLPLETTRAITSTLALSDAVSVIKELIDNALDARATSIQIEISANALDVIQVKDNGFGVGVEDRQLLCKRGCTSKIRTLDDLAELGGRFLGFRGEALASVVEMSDCVVVTTRIEGEVVGSMLKFGSAGVLLSSASASHPVGTTVRVQNLLSKLPVRKQAASKSATSTLNHVRKLLFSYALARPEVRIAFKVLKGKSANSSWSYAPSTVETTLLETATKVLGSDVSKQCTEISSKDDSVNGDTGWRMQAVVITPDSEFDKVSDLEQFMSIDRRPINADRGLMKELTKIYKLYLRNALQHNKQNLRVSKPFLCLQMTCPPNSYDVNIEPAKDELLFYHPDTAKEMFEAMMRDMYGEIEKEDGKTRDKQRSATTGKGRHSFDILLARNKPLQPSSIEPPNSATSSEDSLASVPEIDSDSRISVDNRKFPFQPFDTPGVRPNSPSAFTPGQDSVLNDEAPNLALHVRPQDILDETSRSDNEDLAAVTNPWSLAKLNVRLPPNTTQAFSSNPNARSGPIDLEEQFAVVGATPRDRLPQLPTPEISPENSSAYQNPGPPMRRRARLTQSDDDDEVTSSTQQQLSTGPMSTLIDSWVRPTNVSEEVRQRARPLSLTGLTAPSVVAPSSPALSGLPSSSTPERIKAGLSQRRHAPFCTPFKTKPLALDELAQQSSPRRINDSTGAIHNEASPHQMLPVSTELDEILDFERRKKEVIAQRKRQMQASRGVKNDFQRLKLPQNTDVGTSSRVELGVDEERADFEGRFGSQQSSSQHRIVGRQILPDQVANSPHRNRYLKAVRDLSQTTSAQQDEMETFTHEEDHAVVPLKRSKVDLETPRIPLDDPRAYLIRSMEVPAAAGIELSKTGLKIKRTKSARLPLETIPHGTETCQLSTDYETDLETIRSSVHALMDMDEYVRTGKMECPALVEGEMSEECVRVWEGRLREMLGRLYRPRSGMSDEGEWEAEEGVGENGVDVGLELDLDLRNALK